MSTLDKAFIKAYTKEVPSAADELADPTAGPAPDSHGDWGPAVPAAYSDRLYSDGLKHRVDSSHGDVATSPAIPHVQFTQPTGYTDLAFVSPYHDVPLRETPVEASPQPTAPIAGTPQPGQPVAAALPPSQGEVAVPVAPVVDRPAAAARAAVGKPLPDVAAEVAAGPVEEEEVRETLTSVASLKLPTALELPTVFQPPEADQEEEAVGFSPDWEVDRFAWPKICEQLLQAESRYFQHVGQRLKAATQENRHTVMITGSRRGEGRTTLALCLARCAAEAGVQVAILDADIKNPQLGVRLGMETPCSWLEVVAGKAPLNEAAVSSIEDGLTLFPLSGSEAMEIAAGDDRLIKLLERISVHYPLVIVDSGPLAAEDRPCFGNDDGCPVDTAIVVRDLRYTTAKKALATAEQLQQSGIEAVGIAENFRAAG